MTTTSTLRLHKTLRFEVLVTHDEKHPFSFPGKASVTTSVGDGAAVATTTTTTKAVEMDRGPPSDRVLSIFLDINELYTRQVILEAFRLRAPKSVITLGPGDNGEEEIPLPPMCHFQWSEYERIDWSAVLAGQHGASSYCVRKGLSRKAQLAYHTHLYCCKNPTSILKDHIPKTVILDTWSAWDDHGGRNSSRNNTNTNCGGLADILVSVSAGSDTNVNRRERLDQCLREAKHVMQTAEEDYENEMQRMKNHHLNHDSKKVSPSPPVWILKPSTVNKGVGIEIIHLYEQLVDICWSESDIREWVMQRYIDPPVLLQQRKFHIRAYVLAVSALRVYFYQDCLALCSGRRYRRRDTTDKFSHLTNTALQDLDPDFDEEDNVRLWNDTDAAVLMVSDGTCPSLEVAQERVAFVLDQMKRITGELFQAYKNEFGVFAPIEGCFEHFGFDFMVSQDDWKVYLLEVNPGPDFKQTGSRLSRVIQNLMCDTIDAALLADDEHTTTTTTTTTECHDGTQTIGRLALVYSDEMRPSKSGITMRLT